jgi:ferric-dicitrate binding protein FerR (iron transport regulator)
MDINLLYKKIKGKLTKKEYSQFVKWLKSSQKHQDYYDKFVRYYSKPFHLTDAKREQYRQSFLDYLKTIKAQRTRRKWNRGFLWGSGAVSLAVIVFWGFFLFHQNDHPTLHISKTQGQIMPVSRKSVPATPSKTLSAQVKKAPVPAKVFLKSANGTILSQKQFKYLQAKSGIYYNSSTHTLSYENVNTATLGKDSVKLNELLTKKGGELCVVLNDGTKVWIDSDTKLEYPTAFTNDERTVRLTGEAYFEVKKDASRPFYVITNGMKVRVYGTQFNVNTRYKGTIATSLVEGSVAVIPDGRKETMLTPGHTIEYDPVTHEININDNNLKIYIGWRSGQYVFENTSLHDLFDEISHWYDISAVFSDKALAEESFTGTFSRGASIETVLRMLEGTNYIKIKRDGNIVKVSRR